MKHLGLLTTGLLVLGLTACSSDEPGGASNTDGGGMYAKVSLRLPAPTRAATGDFDGNTNSSDGYEMGKDYENDVKNVTVVLASKDANGFHYITHASSTNPTKEANNTFTLQFDVNALNEWAGQTVYILTYCNVTPQIAGNENGFADIIATVSGDNTWNKTNGFIMANAANVEVPSKTLPSIETLREHNNTPETAFSLGEVKVTRVCSRFDYKQKGGTNTYTITNKIDKSKVGEIELVSMAPVELATEYYYIPRVSADGTNANWTYCGEEFDNYIVSPNFGLKTSPLGDNILGKYTARTTGTDVNLGSATAYEWTDLSKPLGEEDNDADTWTDKDVEGFDQTGYHIWRYVPENTIPSVNSQMEGITTGVLFKAKITSVTNEKFSAAMTARKPVYEYTGTIYGDVDMLRATAYAYGEGSDLYNKFVAVFGADAIQPKTAVDETGKTYIVKDSEGNVEFVKTLTDATAEMNAKGENGKPVFKIYRPDTEGNYFVYYIYRNRHNDNDNPTQMGIMEFGTVRNNVYKLMVNTISNFGYTALPGDDPDFPGPDDPDEDPDTYFSVSCVVLPWMVRVNNIEF